MKKIIAIIPSRYGSSRFPGKPLAKILDKPMIQWVYERVSSVNEICDVYVATDDERIYDVVRSFGGKAIMTGECACGTDRIYQAACNISGGDYDLLDADIILNIQGDEPSIKIEMIEDLISAFENSSVQMATLKKEITDAIIKQVINDLHESYEYIISPDDIVDDFYKDIIREAEDKIRPEVEKVLYERTMAKLGL